MSQVILGNGTAVATELPARSGWSPTRGPYQIRTWKGPHAAIKEQCRWLQAQGYTYELRQSDSGLSTVEATTSEITPENGGGGQTGVVENWELRPNKVQKDILESDCYMVNALTTEEIVKIRKYMEGSKDTSPAFESENATNLLTLLQAGVKTWDVHQPVLTHTITVPLNYVINANWNNLRRVMSLNALTRLERMPFDFIGPIKAITEWFETPTRTDGLVLNYGWRKGYPTVTMGSQGRREYTIDFEFGLWPYLLYGPVVA